MTANYLIRTLYSPESSLSVSFFKTNLSLSFCPQSTGNYSRGTKRYLSTTISDDSAAVLLTLSQSILSGEQTSSMKYVIDCNNQTTVTFECFVDDGRPMQVLLAIRKHREVIPFMFTIRECRIIKNGRECVEFIQTGLIVFTKVLEAYLTAIANERQFSTCFDDEY